VSCGRRTCLGAGHDDGCWSWPRGFRGIVRRKKSFRPTFSSWVLLPGLLRRHQALASGRIYRCYAWGFVRPARSPCAKRLALMQLRRVCPHFTNWVNALEKAGNVGMIPKPWRQITPLANVISHRIQIDFRYWCRPSCPSGTATCAPFLAPVLDRLVRFPLPLRSRIASRSLSRARPPPAAPWNWKEDMQANLWLFLRGMSRDGGLGEHR